jgi:hypothetical protein
MPWVLMCSSLEMRGGPVEQAFHSVKYNRFFVWIGENVPSIEESILSARRCFQIPLKKPWNDFCACNTIELSVKQQKHSTRTLSLVIDRVRFS